MVSNHLITDETRTVLPSCNAEKLCNCTTFTVVKRHFHFSEITREKVIIRSYFQPAEFHNLLFPFLMHFFCNPPFFKKRNLLLLSEEGFFAKIFILLLVEANYCIIFVFNPSVKYQFKLIIIFVYQFKLLIIIFVFNPSVTSLS